MEPPCLFYELPSVLLKRCKFSSLIPSGITNVMEIEQCDAGEFYCPFRDMRLEILLGNGLGTLQG